MNRCPALGQIRTLARGFLAATLLVGSPALILAQDYPTTILSQQPVGYWRLEETTQPIPDNFTAANLGSLGSGESGTYTSDVVRGLPSAFPGGVTSSGFSNPGLSVTYLGPVVDIPSSADLNPSGPFSVEFWAEPSASFAPLLSPVCSLDTTGGGRQGFLFYGGTDGAHGTIWEFRVGDTGGYKGTVYGPSLVPAAWAHIVGVYDGSSIVLYVNGVATAPVTVPSFSPNLINPLRIGATTIPNREWDGGVQEVAVYQTALTAAQVSAHFNTAQTNGANYATAILKDQPIGYWRLNEAPNVHPVATNQGTLGAAGNGNYTFGAVPGQAGPSHTMFPGFPAGNSAVTLNGTNGYVSLPGLNLNTNEITISAWVYSNGTQSTNAGIVFTYTPDSIAGLKLDISDANGLAYDWSGIPAAANFKSGLVIPDSQWAYVALTVTPSVATLTIQDGTGFNSAPNYDATHNLQPFSGEWRIGNDAAYPGDVFNGLIDEVAIFNRALSQGELFTQYSSAIGNQAPQIFSGATGPANDVSIGDPFTVTADGGGTPPLSFQWKVGGKSIAGATSPSYTLAASTLANTGDYTLTVSNRFGSVDSPAVHVNVVTLSAPAITTPPVGRTIYPGGSYTLSVAATGGRLSYQWANGSVLLPGATNSTLTFSPLSVTNSGSYTVTVKNSLGTVTSDPAVLTVLAPAPGSFESVIVGDQPEAWWRLNDPVGATLLADSLGRHDGQYTGTGITLAEPGVGHEPGAASVSFDGSGGYGTIPFSAVLNPKTTFTLEGWAKPNLPGVELTPFSSFSISGNSGRGYGFLKTAGDSWWGITGNNDQYSYYYADLGAIRPNQWAHLVLVSDGSGITFYRDGKYVGGPYGNYVQNQTAPFIIGGRNNDGDVHQFWSGNVAEVAFYRSALTADQILAHYQAALYGNGSAPQFITQPTSATVVVGKTNVFSASVGGSTPLYLQWLKGTTVLDGETNATLTIQPVSFGSAGAYSLVASNAVGVVTSSIANLTVVSVPVYADITDQLVLHLPFDQDASDTSGRTNNGTFVGSPTLVPGIIGTQALHYNTDTTNQVYNYVTLGTPTDLQFSSNINFSVSLWVRLPKGSLSGDLPFLANANNSYGNPGFVFAPSYKLGGWSWSLGNANIYGPDNSINDGKWHHLVFTFDRAAYGTTYLDGVQVDSRLDIGGGDLNTGNSVSIGQDPTGTYGESGSADLDDLGVWQRVLTPFEVWTINHVGAAYGVSFDSTAIPPNASVAISLSSNVDGTTSLHWAVGKLQSAAHVTGPWRDVSGGGTSPYVVSPSGSGLFYRVSF